MTSTPAARSTTTLAPTNTTTVTTVSETAIDIGTTITQPVSTTILEEQPVVLIPLVGAYVEALSGFTETVDTLVREINIVNRIWDTREESSGIYSETEAALVAIAEQTRDLADRVRHQRVPPVLRGMHGEPGGPIRLAAELADMADRVLAGLQVPAPNDGSGRRAALEAFNEVADDFKTSINRVLRYVDESTKPDGLLTVSGQTTTTRALPTVELVDEAVAYVEGLTGFKESLAEIIAEISAVNEAWDNRAETGVTYSATEDALVEIAERASDVQEQVDNHPVPKPIRTLAEGPPREVAGIVQKVNEVLAGLRIPAPNTGFERLAALDDLHTVSRAFEASVNHVIYEVYAKAHTSGLAAQD